MADRAREIAGILLYLFSVSVVLAIIGPVGFSENFDPIDIDVYQFDDTGSFIGAGNDTAPAGWVTDKGEWIYNETTGYTSMGDGENRILMETNLTGGTIREIRTYTFVNTNGAPFRVYTVYTPLLWVFDEYRGYEFLDTGWRRIGSMWGETTDITPYNSGVDFYQMKVTTTYEGPVGEDRRAYMALSIDGVSTDSISSLPWTMGLWVDYRIGGISVDGSGFGITTYSVQESPSTRPQPTDVLGATWEYVTLTVMVLGFTLPPWLFTELSDFLIMLIVNVVFVKIPLIYLGIMVLEIWRGN